MTAIADKIMKRARVHGRGFKVYTPRDFLDLGNRDAVDQALARLVKAKQLRRVARGLYDYPRVSAVLDRPVPPTVEAIAAAKAGKVMPDGIASAYALGLTNAVPAKASFVTDGYEGAVIASGRTVSFMKASKAVRPWLGHPGAPVVIALQWLGHKAVDNPTVIPTLRTRLPDDVKANLRRGIGKVPGWAQDIVRQVVAADHQAA